MQAWCRVCNAETEMIPLDVVGVVSNLPPVEVQQWMESNDLHLAAAADGTPMICLNSILKRVCKTRNA